MTPQLLAAFLLLSRPSHSWRRWSFSSVYRVTWETRKLTGQQTYCDQVDKSTNPFGEAIKSNLFKFSNVMGTNSSEMLDSVALTVLRNVRCFCLSPNINYQ
eukprot:4866016-Amphidinium_carterae.1